MYQSDFAHVRTWVFDLDNTLYPPSARLFDQIERKMEGFIMAELSVGEADARQLRREYWRTHGTTLAGLMAEHGMAPDAFLEAVHDIDLSGLQADIALRDRIAALPGQKIVYTNGSREHARRVTRARGLSGTFDALFGIEDAGFVPKPHADAFIRVFAAGGVVPTEAAMFEDEARNLAAPFDMGLRTVLIGPAEAAAHVHHQSEDLTDFLSRVV